MLKGKRIQGGLNFSHGARGLMTARRNVHLGHLGSHKPSARVSQLRRNGPLMSRQTHTGVVLLLIGLTALTGCHPTQPFYFHEDGDLSHYLDQATALEYPDVEAESLPDATQTEAPLTISDPEFHEMWDLTLEECIAIALQNSKVIRNLGGVTPFGFADGLVSRTGSATVYDPAIVSSGTSSPFASGSQGPLNFRVTSQQVGGVEAALADFDAQLAIAGAAGGSPSGLIAAKRDRPQNFRSTGFFPQVDQTTTGGLDTSLFKRSASGGRYTFRNTTYYDRFDGDVAQTLRAQRSTWTTQFEMRWDQPLLRGRGTQINRIPIVLARINEDISLASFEAAVRNLVLDMENTYWDLHLAYRTVETAKISRDAAQRTWENIHVKVPEQATIQEEAQAREQYFFFRSALEDSLRQLYETETRLRFLMGLAATDGRLIRPIDEPTLARVKFDWRAIRAEALIRSPELRQQKWSLKQRELELISAKNQLLPQLDVGALYRWVGVGDDLIDANSGSPRFPADGSTAFNELASGDYQEASLIFNFQLPVGFRREMAGVRNAQLQVARTQAVLEDMELNTTHLLSTAYRNLDSTYVLAQTHFNRWIATREELQARRDLVEGGKETVEFLLDAQRRRAQAMIDYYRSIAEYAKAIASVHFRKNSLLEYNNIQLAEGPWADKAYWDAMGLARERDASYYLDYGWTRPNVISQGPVSQGGVGATMEGPAAEWVPTPEPTPAGKGEILNNGPVGEGVEDLPAPTADEGEITLKSNVPNGDRPASRSFSDATASTMIVNPLRNQEFEWGGLGLDAPEGVPQSTSPVRTVSYNSNVGDE